MGDTEHGSWGSNELGGYLRREEARAMDRHERAAEAAATEEAAGGVLAGLAIIGATILVTLGLILWAVWWAVGKLAGGL